MLQCAHPFEIHNRVSASGSAFLMKVASSIPVPRYAGRCYGVASILLDDATKYNPTKLMLKRSTLTSILDCNIPRFT